MRQVGILAAAGLVSLDTIVPGMNTDHEKVRRIAEGKTLSRFLSNLKDLMANTPTYSSSLHMI